MTIGVAGDYYIDTVASVLYGPKTAQGWPSTGLSLLGPAGPTGAASTVPGPTGPAGNTVIAGTSASAPTSSVGNNGDFFLTTAYVLYGPKSGGAWPASGFSLVGPAGSSGAAGPAGPAGAAGNTVLNGANAPTAAIGNNGDFYLATQTEQLYGPKAAGAWPGSGISLIGPAGAAGAAGNTVLHGTGGPGAAVGNVGDFYIDTTAYVIYGPKGATGWNTQGTSIIGPTGSAGSTGPAGPTGPASTVPGPAGTSIDTGTSNPTAAIGNNGDVYLNTATSTLFGPKASGSWPSTGTSLIGPTGATGSQGPAGATGPAGAVGSTGATGATGPAGPTGATGATGAAGTAGTNGTNGTNGNTIITGASSAAPANTVGNNGDYFLTTANVLYGPKAAGVWPSTGTSLVGPAGATGATGATGAASTVPGPTGATGPQGPQGINTLGAAGVGVGPLAYTSTQTLSATPAILPSPGSAIPSYYISQSAGGALIGLYVANNGPALTNIECYDLTSATSIYKSGAIATGSNFSAGPFTNTQYPITTNDSIVWRITGASGTANAMVIPYYLFPSATAINNVSFIGSALTAASSTFTGTLVSVGTPGTPGTNYVFRPIRTGSLYNITVTYVPSGGTTASSSVSVALSNFTATTTVLTVSASATGTPTISGPYTVSQYPLLVNNVYYYRISGSGTGQVQIDTQVIV